MDGVHAVRTVFIADAPLVALVVADSIHAGPLPLGARLPAIALTSVSTIDRNIPSPGPLRHVRERVQAMVHAKNYPEQKAIKRALRGAAADQVDVAVEGITDVTIHTEGGGPDFFDESASIWMGAQDFITTFSEQR